MGLFDSKTMFSAPFKNESPADDVLIVPARLFQKIG
jgi:hypothetical protein